MGNKTAITYGSDYISYSRLTGNIEQFADQYNISKGARVAIFMENRPEWVYAFYSVWKNGGIAVPIDYLATPDEVAFILNDCQPEVIFTSAGSLPVIKEAITKAAIDNQIILADEITLQQEKSSINDIEIADKTQTAVIIYTSGTTGSPKGVMLSFNNLMANIKGVAHDIKIFTSASRTLMLLPLHHIFPLMGTMIIPLYAGGSVAISPSMASEDIIKTLQDNKITILLGVPRLYAAIRKGIKDKINASAVARLLFSIAGKLNSPSFSKTIFKAAHQKMGGHLKYLVSGGAALDPEVARDYQILGFEVLEGYGMTESAPMITFTRPGRVLIGSPGEALPGTIIESIDGEITIKGPQIMQGYYNRPEETDKVLKEGRLFTGDLGHVDQKGYLFITGRKKEIIVLSNGKNVNPSELETKLEDSPLVRECGVFFKDDMLQAVIVPEKSAIGQTEEQKIEDIIRWKVIDVFNQQVSSYKKIMRFHLTDQDLPRTRLSKLQRFKLEDFALEEEKSTEPRVLPDFEEYKMITDYLSREKGRDVLPHYHLEMDLGLDSLDKVGFETYLNQTFGVKIDPVEMLRFNNVLLLAEHVREVKTKVDEQKINWRAILREKVPLQLPKTWATGSIMVRLSRLFFHSYFRFNARGMKNIPEGPCIIAPNHQSFFDGLFVASYLRTRQIKKTYFYAKEKHVKTPWLKFLANRNNIIIMDLNNDLKASIQKMAEVLKRNKNLIIFPEGTRTKNGQLGQFKKTFAILSRELNIPVVPVSIRGAFEALPKGSFFPKPFKKVDIEFLKPVYPGEDSYDSLAVRVKEQIQYNLKSS
ncbi:long-chain acyl-CoA synthetase [Marinilabilia salmonicolor]|jgi:long-chain acyl-CoA synthetase|uniref:Long-chain acyl-CoA synthetase n=2 Tax=Marinilabilia salmonicolor TaxID=989 RepID=A0A368VHA7_9BACT|nr:long-chain acyl-CoA synthetase [Marinilabilia salmonicolor]